METNRAKKKKQPNSALKLKNITGITETQKKFFRNYNGKDVISLNGCPGTGKTFLALYSALDDIERNYDVYNKVIIIRSSVAVRDAGFLPGSIKDKMAVYEAPYQALCTELYNRGDAYEILKNKGLLEFTSTAYMRGITFRDCIVIVDECQNMSFQELHTILTRIGDNCKLLLCGDIYQDDLTSKRYNEQSGYKDMLNILHTLPRSTYAYIDFKIDDIVRSGFVKDYILARMRSGTEKDNVHFLVEENIEKSLSLV